MNIAMTIALGAEKVKVGVWGAPRQRGSNGNSRKLSRFRVARYL